MKTFDSYAWIEYFAGTGRGKLVRTYVEGNDPLFTPSVCLTEIKAKYLKEGKDPSARLDFILDRGPIIALDEEIALKAAEFKIHSRLHTVDALIYAAARSKETVLVTGDRHFKGLKDIEFLS